MAGRTGAGSTVWEQSGAARYAIVVVNYGSTGLIRANLAGIDADDRCRVVIVDNFSSANEQARVAELCRERGWQSVLLPDNIGFGAGVDAGMDAARGQGASAYVILNPDAQIDRQTADALADHVLAEPLELVAPLITRPDGTVWAAGFGVDLRSGRMRRRPGLRDLEQHEAPWLTGACLGLSETLAQRLGGMPEGYFLYWEDVDLSLAVPQVDGTLRVREDLIVIHDEGGTQRDAGQASQRRLSDRYYFYNCRNRLLFASRHLDRRALLSWILRTPQQSWLILLRGGRRQLLESPRPLLAAVRGSLAGIGIGLRGMLSSRRMSVRPGLRTVDTPR